MNSPAEAALQHGDDDRRVMQAFCDGDESAFDVLFRRWSGRVLRFLERMIREPAVAEELLQETFLRVHRAREKWEPSARFSTWLFTIASNLALNELRRPFRRSAHESTDAEREGAIVPRGHELERAGREGVPQWVQRLDGSGGNVERDIREGRPRRPPHPASRSP